jgi:hypothetical protein
VTRIVRAVTRPEATRRSRHELRDRRGDPAFFDRGPGYATLS